LCGFHNQSAGLVGPEQNLTVLGGRAVALANLPSSPEDFIYILLDEWEKAHSHSHMISSYKSFENSFKERELRFAVQYAKLLFHKKPQILLSKLNSMKMCSMFAGSFSFPK
jgi:hypothetical protein